MGEQKENEGLLQPDAGPGKNSDTVKKPNVKGKKQKVEEEEEMPEEDKLLKEKLDGLVSKITESISTDDRLKALQDTADELRVSTDSMSSVPKPLKFLRPHFSTLEKSYITVADNECKKYIADLLSVLGTTVESAVKTVPLKEPADSTDSGKIESAAIAGNSKTEADATNAEQGTKEPNGKPSDPPTPPKRFCLRYRLLGGATPLVSWGHEYVTSLAADICTEFNAIINKRLVEGQSVPDPESPLRTATLTELHDLVDEIVPFYMKRSSYIDAVDLLAETDDLPGILRLVDDKYERIAEYIISMALYEPIYDVYEETMLVAYDIYFAKKNWPMALRVALRLPELKGLVMRVLNRAYDSGNGVLITKQLAFMIHRQRYNVDWSKIGLREYSGPRVDFPLTSDTAEVVDADEFAQDCDVAVEPELYSELCGLAGGRWLSEHFLRLAEELDVMEPKTPDDIYKSYLEENRPDIVGSAIDSAKQNLAATYVNGFVNMAFCSDKLMTTEGSPWLYKNRDHGMTAASASVGLITLWNMDEALIQVDKLHWSQDANVKAGALLAFGVFDSTVRNEWDTAFSLVGDHLGTGSLIEQQCAILGLGFGYCGTGRADVTEVLIPIAVDSSSAPELSGMAALALGLINVATCSEEVAEVLVQVLIDRGGKVQEPTTNNEGTLEYAFGCLTCVGLGLLFLGRKDMADGTNLMLAAIPGPLKRYASVTLEGLAFAFTGDVLKVQRMLHVERSDADEVMEESKDSSAMDSLMVGIGKTTDTAGASAVVPAAEPGAPEAPEAAAQTAAPKSGGGAKQTDTTDTCNLEEAVAVVNIPMIAFGESTGMEMVLPLMENILQFGNLTQRRAVPLAIAMHSVSQPKPHIIDTLSKLSHDHDADVALHAIIALGIVSAGTNHAKVATLLRQLATYYGKDSNGLFTVRIAQGLLYMSKGLVTLNPSHSDGRLVDSAAFASLVVFLHVCQHFKTLVLGRHHLLLYSLAPAVYPRMLVTVDEDLKPCPIAVRVGQAVDVTALAGNPRTVTGFQTHNTPVLLGAGERVELADDSVVPLTPVLEGLVIVRKKTEAELAEDSQTISQTK